MIHDVRAGSCSITGVSIGGVYTSLLVPEFDVAFDVGMAIRAFSSVRTLLLSHGHVDHAGALSSLLGIRALHGVKAPLRVVMPAEIVAHVTHALDAMSVLQRWPLAIDPVGLRPGEEFPLRADLWVRAHQAFHVVPCLSYQLFRRVQTRRPEFLGLPGPDIARRRAAGEDLFDTHDHLELAYATDTLVSVLDFNPSLYDSRVLVIEATFLDERKSMDAVRAGCHIHLDELIERADRFRNEHIVLMHVSQIYRPDEVAGILEARLPPALRSRVQVLGPLDPGVS